jgi:hypothetical protein
MRDGYFDRYATRFGVTGFNEGAVSISLAVAALAAIESRLLALRARRNGHIRVGPSAPGRRGRSAARPRRSSRSRARRGPPEGLAAAHPPSSTPRKGLFDPGTNGLDTEVSRPRGRKKAPLPITSSPALSETRPIRNDPPTHPATPGRSPWESQQSVRTGNDAGVRAHKRKFGPLGQNWLICRIATHGASHGKGTESHGPRPRGTRESGTGTSICFQAPGPPGLRGALRGRVSSAPRPVRIR